MFKKFTFQTYRHIFPFLIFGLIIGLCINIIFFKFEFSQLTKEFNRGDENMSEIKWDYVRTVLEEDYLSAGDRSKYVAVKIDRELRAAYPNLDKLKYQLDFPNNVDNPAYGQILKSNIKGKFLFGIKNDNNDMFVASRDGILMDLSLNCLPETLPRRWPTEFNIHYNKPLAENSINKILNHSRDIIFWEFLPNSNPDHYMIAEPSIDELHELFMREGLEGLKGIEFLAPAYITEEGDIFGVDDVSDLGIKMDNHKIIIIQGFNLYDQIISRHNADIQKFDNVKDEFHMQMEYIISVRVFSILFSTILTLFIVYILIIFNNRIFYEKGFYKENGEVSEEPSK